MQQIKMPRRTGALAHEERRAVCHSLCTGPVCSSEHVPREVADELGLKDGDEIVVVQRPILHTDDAKLARRATGEDHVMEPMELLQAVIDLTVQDSNISIHPGKDEGYARVLVRDMDAPATAWWLYRFLGADRVMRRITTASGTMEGFKKKSPAFSQEKNETSMPNNASGRSS